MFANRRCCKFYPESLCLEGEQDEEGNHQTEKTHGLGQGETQNGVGEELRLQRWVAGVANDEGAENCSDTSSGTGNANGGGTSANELGGGVDVTVDNRDGEG